MLRPRVVHDGGPGGERGGVGTAADRRELAEVRNQAETLLYTTEAALEGYQDLVDGEMIERTRESCKRLRELIDQQGDLTSIRSQYQDLEALTFKIAESLYGTG